MAPLESSLVSEVLSIAVPNVIGYLLTIVNEVTNTIFIGHAGTETEQAAVGLAIMMQNCVAVNVAFGLLGALDTLVSQGYGAGERELCCMHLQRGRAISAAQLLWMVPLLWFTAPVLELLQQDAAVAAHAQAYNRATIPGLLFFFQFEAARKFLINFGAPAPAAQPPPTCPGQQRGYPSLRLLPSGGEVVGPAAITAAASVLHVGWSAFWVLHMRMGNAGVTPALELEPRRLPRTRAEPAPARPRFEADARRASTCICDSRVRAPHLGAGRPRQRDDVGGAAGTKAPSTLSEDTVPSASLDHPKLGPLLRTPERSLSSSEARRGPGSSPQPAPKLRMLPLATR